MLKQIFGSTPKWQSPKSQRRLEAIAELQTDQVKDVEVLSKLAREDSEPLVRREAIKKLYDIDLLQQIQRRDLEASVRDAASTRIHELLAGKDASGPTLEERLERVRRLTATQTLRYLIMEANPIEVRVAAVEQLTDEIYLEDIALKSGIARLRQIAAERIQNPKVLESLANLSKHADKGVYRIARDKLDAMHGEEKTRRQHEEKLQGLCEAMEQHARAAGNPLFKAKTESLMQQWRELAAEASPAQAERFETAFELAQKIVEEQLAREHQEREQAQAAREQAASCEMLELALAELQAQPDAFDLPALAALIKTQDLRWQVACEILPAVPGLHERYKRGQAALHNAQNLMQAVQSQRSELESSIQSAQDAAAQGEPGDMEPLTRIMASMPPSQGLPLPSILKMAYGLLEKKKTVTSAVVLPMPERKPRPDAEKHRQLGLQLDALEEAIQSGNSRDATHKLRDIQHFTKEHHLHDNRLPGLMQRLQELRDWAGFAVLPKKQALLEEMQVLADRAMDPDEKADAIKVLQDSWKALGVTDPHTENPLWEQFKAASDKAYEPCREYFHEQRELRAQNLAKRQQVCDELDRYLDALPENISGKQIEALIHTAREEWQRYHPVERQQNQALQQRFNKILKRLETLLKNTHGAHEQQKRALIAETRALLESSDVRAACLRVKDFQAQWKAIEPGSRKHDQLLWKEFRELCDQLFARRDAEIQARKSALQLALDEAELLIASQQQLAEAALQGEHNRSLGEPLVEAFRALDIPREQRAELQKRFENARRQHEHNLKYARQHQQEVELNRIIAAFALCAQAEAAVHSNTLSGTELRTASARYALGDPWQGAFIDRVQALLEVVDDADLAMQFLVLAAGNADTARELCLDLEVLLELPSPPDCREARLQKQMVLLQQNAFNRGADAREARIKEKLQALLELPLPDADAVVQAGILERLAALLRSGKIAIHP
jgi:hypothetical protein